ncbi:hypothetical protein M514_19534 [Trichuris suis]|uniref:Tc1-like transposase DDE domain-containing protein n=1 Tax=Trichuris suis TaxID=68888 RepID=A0A085NFM6_9BILA|nr:hypothetical protein M514_19534 [Trichuris suis]
MNVDRFPEQLKKAQRAWRKKRRKYAANLVHAVLMQDNVGSSPLETFEQLNWEPLAIPLYSPDISPADYYLFPSMEQELSDQHFADVSEIGKWVTHFFNSKSAGFYHRGIYTLPKRWDTVLDNEGAYIE